jgi:hypothetical protein
MIRPKTNVLILISLFVVDVKSNQEYLEQNNMSTSVLGAILLTGYLGGAVATHLRVGDPLFSHTLFPVYFAILLWGGLYLRSERVRAMVPFQRQG